MLVIASQGNSKAEHGSGDSDTGHEIVVTSSASEAGNGARD